MVEAQLSARGLANEPFFSYKLAVSSIRISLSEMKHSKRKLKTTSVFSSKADHRSLYYSAEEKFV